MTTEIANTLRQIMKRDGFEQDFPEKDERFVAAVREVLEADQVVPEEIPQNWSGVDGAVAWHLIDRHAEGWAAIGRSMDEWKAANTNHLPSAGEMIPVTMEVTPALAHLAYERAFAEGDVVDFSLRIARHVSALIRPTHYIPAAEIERLQRNDARYRWLSYNASYSIHEMLFGKPAFISTHKESDLADCIDAAIAGETK